MAAGSCPGPQHKPPFLQRSAPRPKVSSIRNLVSPPEDSVPRYPPCYGPSAPAPGPQRLGSPFAYRPELTAPAAKRARMTSPQGMLPGEGSYAGVDNTTTYEGYGYTFPRLSPPRYSNSSYGKTNDEVSSGLPAVNFVGWRTSQWTFPTPTPVARSHITRSPRVPPAVHTTRDCTRTSHSPASSKALPLTTETRHPPPATLLPLPLRLRSPPPPPPSIQKPLVDPEVFQQLASALHSLQAEGETMAAECTGVAATQKKIERFIDGINSRARKMCDGSLDLAASCRLRCSQGRQKRELAMAGEDGDGDVDGWDIDADVDAGGFSEQGYYL
ncbi:hypothetical protein B0T22DRAFT_435870 [Podospora appendiculata]|uniref:Uncharacterized protein n=1 Tax=Podospora appendiculata TaxID=314037 RepID=A0AAE0XFP5_9PEZI|nr:hypothetical protein B0T22DRAFT_435870 [Podospora appendiculata]